MAGDKGRVFLATLASGENIFFVTLKKELDNKSFVVMIFEKNNSFLRRNFSLIQGDVELNALGGAKEVS